MKVVIAPDSFKDALRAGDVAQRIAGGLRSVLPDVEINLCPVADGGEGFADAVTFGHPGAERHTSRTVDPLGRKIKAPWVMLRDHQGKPETAAIELAAASGLELLKPEERNPIKTSTYGTGLMMRDAIDKGASRILLGIGGSATTDAGIGIAFTFGVGFSNYQGKPYLKTNMPGGIMRDIAEVFPSHPENEFLEVPIIVACDVTNPLTGPNGAAHVYGPQKGATPEQVEQLDAGLRHMAKLWRDQLGIDAEHLPGAGAAGGVGGGLVAMLGAELVPGAELVLDVVGFNERIKGAGLVITGEGRLDSQSLSGKAAMTVAKRAKAARVPCVALVGCVGAGAEAALEHGVSRYLVIGAGLTAAESIRRTGELLEQAAARVAREHLGS